MFEVGQKWENPEGVICEITNIIGYKIIYKTPDDIGFQSVERFSEWKRSGAIELIDEKNGDESITVRCDLTEDMFNDNE